MNGDSQNQIPTYHSYRPDKALEPVSYTHLDVYKRQEQGRRSTLVPISQELATGYQGCSEFWRLPHRMVQQELQNDLPEYGTW